MSSPLEGHPAETLSWFIYGRGVAEATLPCFRYRRTFWEGYFSCFLRWKDNVAGTPSRLISGI